MKKIVVVIAIIIALGVSTIAIIQKPLSVNGRSKRRKARNIKIIPPKKGIYHGAYPDFGGAENIVNRRRISAFQNLAGKKIVWAYFSNNWGRKIRFPNKAARIIRRAGKIPYIRMMPRSNMYSESKTKYTLQRIISGRFDKNLKKWAKDAKRFHNALIVEFGTEVNGEWFPWNGKYNGGGRKNGFGSKRMADGPERFRAAYKHIINIFRKQKVRNITWVFHANNISVPDVSWNKMKAYYPGDKYIDWLGISIYGSQDIGEEWENFNDLLNDVYKEFASISKKKPLALLEFGVVEDPKSGDKAAWISNALKTIKNRKYRRFKAISYWHEKWENDDGIISNLRLDSSQAALNAYKQAIKDPFFVTKPRARRR